MAENTEIEVTPEMIGAARDTLNEHYLGDGVYELTPEVIAAVYSAMEIERFRAMGEFPHKGIPEFLREAGERAVRAQGNLDNVSYREIAIGVYHAMESARLHPKRGS